MPSIYVADLAAYNNGTLHGRWIDLDGLTVEDVQQQIAEMLQEVPSAEEWAVHDYDDCPDFGEHPDLSKVIAYAEALDEVGEGYAEAFRVWFEDDTCKEPDADAFFEAFIGDFDSWAHLAENLLDEAGELDEIPERLRGYFDYASYGRDLQLGGDVWESRGYYFWSR